MFFGVKTINHSPRKTIPFIISVYLLFGFYTILEAGIIRCCFFLRRALFSPTSDDRCLNTWLFFFMHNIRSNNRKLDAFHSFVNNLTRVFRSTTCSGVSSCHYILNFHILFRLDHSLQYVYFGSFMRPIP